jgi:hypothetical protein
MVSFREPLDGITASALEIAMMARNRSESEALVGQEAVEIEAVDQRLGMLAFVRFARGWENCKRVTKGVDSCV